MIRLVDGDIITCVKVYTGWRLYVNDILMWCQKDGCGWPVGFLKEIWDKVEFCHCDEIAFWEKEEWEDFHSLSELKEFYEAYLLECKKERLKNAVETVETLERELGIR